MSDHLSGVYRKGKGHLKKGISDASGEREDPKGPAPAGTQGRRKRYYRHNDSGVAVKEKGRGLKRTLGVTNDGPCG